MKPQIIREQRDPNKFIGSSSTMKGMSGTKSTTESNNNVQEIKLFTPTPF